MRPTGVAVRAEAAVGVGQGQAARAAQTRHLQALVNVHLAVHARVTCSTTSNKNAISSICSILATLYGYVAVVIKDLVETLPRLNHRNSMGSMFYTFI